ncbi:S1C family serine protease [Chryseomicrobium sp. FSL W7-1435]|uniref:S1C family serine protease n=1 Tax=Chryseomicrobium sp. FSL W7-1435 TaxID=2921704 RepID=UPI00315AA293
MNTENATRKGKIKPFLKSTSLVVLGVLLGLNLSGFYFNQPETNTDTVSSAIATTAVVQSDNYSELIKSLSPQVVTIYTETGMGSGFLYGEEGYVITNAHVTLDGTEVEVWNAYGHYSEGEIIGISEFMDIALVKVPDYVGEGGLAIDREAIIPVGSPILTISAPYGLEHTASLGYITGRERNLEMESSSSYNQFIQFDGQVGPGSSGGPLFDRVSGEVIGIITQTGGDYGEIKYAIPVEDALYYVDRWMKTPMDSKTIEEIQSNLKQLYEWE